jgi:polyisoprenoid-binding protein YceI
MTFTAGHGPILILVKRLFFLLACMLTTAAAAGADGPCIVPQRGYFRIHVGTAGVFGAFAHNHLIEAQRIAGCASVDPKDVTHSSIRLTFTTADLRVMDPKESEKNRAEVQKTMETEVLRISEFPQVVFESTSIENAGGNELRMRGNLTISGNTRSVVIPVTLSHTADGTLQAQGRYNFKQSTFGIKPIQLGGGTIKVKDELETEFEVYLK